MRKLHFDGELRSQQLHNDDYLLEEEWFEGRVMRNKTSKRKLSS